MSATPFFYREQLLEFARRNARQPVSGYLLRGPLFSGKRAFADFFGRQILCEKSIGCGECMSCEIYTKGTHPDFIVVSPEGGKLQIGIEQIHAVRARLQTKPLLSSNIVVIGDGVDGMTKAAANAFLKMLEEPHANTTFILTDHRRYPLISTITSRCQHILFEPAQPSTLEAWLVDAKKITKKQASTIAYLAKGLAHYAVQLAENKALLEERAVNMESLADAIIIGGRQIGISGESWDEKQAHAKQILEDCRYIWHNILLYSLGLDSYLKTYHNQVALQRLITTVSLKVIAEKIAEVQRNEKALAMSVPGSLLLESLF